MTFTLPQLPYTKDSLKPFISSETLEYHHGKHLANYINKLNELISNTPYEKMALVTLIKLKPTQAIFNNAAQVYNHQFYFNCFCERNDLPTAHTIELIESEFGSFDNFKNEFNKKALNHFGSGWIWLVWNKENKLEIIETHDADTPICYDLKPILTCDVWEHAYYIDTRNDRKQYLTNFWNIIDWDFVEANMQQQYIP